MIRPLSVLFLLLSSVILLSSQKALTPTSSEGVPLENIVPTSEIRQGSKVKEVKLEDEIESIGKVIHSEVVVIQDPEELKIKDTIEVKRESIEDTSEGEKLSTTEKPKSPVDTSIDAVEKGLGGVEDGEKLRQPSENELAEMSEKMKEGKEEEEVTSTARTEPVLVHEEVEKEEELIEPTTRNPIEEHPEEGINGSIMLEEPVIKVKEEQESEQESEEEETDEDKEDSKISWDLIELLLWLAPGERKEADWWTMIVEAVKCSLRNCPYPDNYWRRVPVHMPRITRHRRQHDDFDPTEEKPKKSECACRKLEEYLEKLYESIVAKKEEKEMKMNVTQS